MIMLKRLLVIVIGLMVWSPAWAATDFLLAPGTNGSVIATPLVWMTTELNGLAAGACATSSVGGSSGAFSQTSTGISGAGAPAGYPYLTPGSSFTPIAGEVLEGWFLHSYNGGTNFEGLPATCSTTQAPLARPPDFVVPFAPGATTLAVYGPKSLLTEDTYKIEVWLCCTSAASLPSTGNSLTIFPTALQY